MLAANPFPGGSWPTPLQELLLGAALHLDRDRAAECWREWFRRTQAEGLDEGTFRMLPLVLYNLRRAGFDDPFFGRLEGIHRKMWVKCQHMFHELKPALEALVAANIPVMLMKGAPLAASVYPDAGRRPMRDLDVLVPESRLRDARSVLHQQGWRVLTWTPRGDPPEYLSYRHGVALRRGHYELDLHWHFTYLTCHHGADEIFWRAAEPFSFLDLALLRPGAADQLLQLCVHGCEWNEIPPMRWVTDAILLLRSAAPLDWKRVTDVARDYRLVMSTRAALDYLARRFEAPIPPAVLAALEQEEATEPERLEFQQYNSPFPSHPGLSYKLWHVRHRLRRARFSPFRGIFRLAPLRFVQYAFGIDTLPRLLLATAPYLFRRLQSLGLRRRASAA